MMAPTVAHASCRGAAGSTSSPVVPHSDAKAYRVTHIAQWLSRLGAGLSKVALEVGVAQQKCGLEVSWACHGDNCLDEDLASSLTDTADRVHAFAALGPRQLAISPGFRAGVEPIIAQSHVIHIHGNWSSPCHTAAKLARKHATPYLVTVHGMLEPWALRHRRWRKVVASYLFERKFLDNSACVHALVESEYGNIRRFGCSQPVAIIPNGIHLADFDGEPLSHPAPDQWPQLRNRRAAIFLSRVHPKKGLPLLLSAWAKLAPRQAEWILVIAGPNENGHRQQVEQLTRDLGISSQVLFTGPVYGRDKLSLLRHAELFVLPSHSEGFSMAVLEAMACRLPVLITPHCNFPEVETNSAGRVAADRVPDLKEALGDLMDCGPVQLAQMGHCGRLLVERKYTWDRVARQTISVYQWLIEGGSPPSCVVMQ